MNGIWMDLKKNENYDLETAANRIVLRLLTSFL